MSLSLSQILTLLLCWLAYAVLHSLLASLWLKRGVAARWPRLAPGYRLAFNVLAVVLLVPPLHRHVHRHRPIAGRHSQARAGTAATASPKASPLT